MPGDAGAVDGVFGRCLDWGESKKRVQLEYKGCCPSATTPPKNLRERTRLDVELELTVKDRLDPPVIFLVALSDFAVLQVAL